ncbi:MAG: substrate-binding domain-containing protein [Kiritimatiellia bacterium]
MGDTRHEIPFTISPRNGARLAVQTADGFRKAILSGYYRPGDVLPTFRELAKLLGTSIRIPIEAFKILSTEGLVVSRQGSGSVVLAPGERVWKGCVTFVSVGADASPFTNLLAAAVRERVSNAGYLFVRAAVPVLPDGGYDYAALDMVLGKTVNLAILIYDHPEVARHIAVRGVPYVAYLTAHRKLPSCLAQVVQNRGSAVPAFVAHCRAAGIRRVVQIAPETSYHNATAELAAAGIRSEFLHFPYVTSADPYMMIEDIRRSAFAYCRDFLRNARKLPDLLTVADDFYAEGALTAIAACGLRIPRDLRFVAWSNRGFGPVWSQPLTRVELDPHRSGSVLAEAVLAYLQGGTCPKRFDIHPEYIVGASFPAP